MTTPSAQSAKNEHESVNEKPFRLLASEALAFANNAQNAEWDNIYWRAYWTGVIQGIRSANGELGARREAHYVINLAKRHIADKV